MILGIMVATDALSLSKRTAGGGNRYKAGNAQFIHCADNMFVTRCDRHAWIIGLEGWSEQTYDRICAADSLFDLVIIGELCSYRFNAW